MGGGLWPREGKKRKARPDIARRRERQRDWESCYRTRKRRILRSDTHWPRHEDASRDSFYFLFSPNEQRARGGGGGGEGGAARLFFFFFFSPVQQTTSGIGHRFK